MMFNLDGADVRHDPFPIAFAKPVFDADLYQEMLDNWPDTERFQFMPKLGNKYSLSEVNNQTIPRLHQVDPGLETLSRRGQERTLRARHRRFSGRPQH